MQQPLTQKLRWRKPRQADRGNKSIVKRLLRGGISFGLGLVAVILLGAGLFYARLSVGPVSLGRLPDRIGEALADRIGPGWTVALRKAALQVQSGSPALLASGLDIRDPQGILVVSAPYATVSVDTWSLLMGSLQPRSIELRDLQLRAVVTKDGSLAFLSDEAADADGPGKQDAAHSAPPPQAVSPIPLPRADGASPVSAVVGSLFTLVAGRNGVLSSLDRAHLTNAHLTIIDSHQKERAAFKRLDATFTREAGSHHFDATLDGPQGAWQLSGDASGDEKQGYRASVIAADAPLQDVLLLSGLSKVPATTDLKLSGRVDAAYAGGLVTELKARLDSEKGMVQIDDKDTSPLLIDHSTIAMTWEEQSRTLQLETLALKGGDTDVRLQGRLVAFSPDEGWHLNLSGKDVALSGAAAGDPPVRLSDLDADLSGPDGVAIHSIALHGPNVSARITGQLLSRADPAAIHLDVHGDHTDVRSAVRIWPEAVAPPVRHFLVGNLKAGSLDAIDLKVDMSGDDVAKSVSGGPIPDKALNIGFAISQATLQAAEGVPPLTKMQVSGIVTGTTVTLRAPSGQADLAGGRVLGASDGAFDLKDYWNKDAMAQIQFRLLGGADGLGALLQAPRIHDMAGFDLDPAMMKGRTDLRVGIGLAVAHVPAFADLPINVSGTLNDLSVDKLFGKDRLDNANLALGYDRGNLSIKGDGKLGGSPATIEVHQTRDGGDATISTVLDEAARARRGISFGSQLTGPLAVKASLLLGHNAKPGTRIEADLAKASIDQLIPGWIKPAGRPGKVSFTLVEGTGGSPGSSTEIRDLQLDSGPVQIRGTAQIATDGTFEKADLTTFKLSSGDDMRAQIERANNIYKVVVRGNTGDARPFTKTLSSAPAPAPSSKPGTSPSPPKDRDFDLDLSLNILTGYNDEAITGVSVKASVRKDNIRQLDMKGRLGATDVVSRTVQQSGAAPIIVLQAQDAGALLSFLDIYRRMTGGDMTVQLVAGDGPQGGTLTLRDFTLENEPALRRIIPTQTQIIAGRDASGHPKTVQVDTNRVDFAKARVDFTRNAGRLDFKDAAIWGDSIGFTLDGMIDYPHNRMDITGTFVPAYGLNNVFAQVPLFGPLLGGSQYEGLFAVNFRVAGQVDSPTLTVNPLSAVAPGFLRKLFGTGGGEQPPDFPTEQPK